MDSLAKFLEVSPMWIKSYVPTSYSVLYVLYIIVQMYIRFEYNKNLLYFLWSFQILFFTIKWEELYSIHSVHLQYIYIYMTIATITPSMSHMAVANRLPHCYIYENSRYTLLEKTAGGGSLSKLHY